LSIFRAAHRWLKCMNAAFALPFVAVALAIFAAGCQNSSPVPTSPSAPSSPSSSPPSKTFNITGHVRDTLLRPISDAKIEIVDPALAGHVTTTDQDGRFTFPPLTAALEAVTLSVTKDEYSPATARARGNGGITVILTALDLVALDGQYTMTFTAASACDQLPPALRTRTYMATIGRTTSNHTLFTIELSGAAFYPGYSIFSAVVADDTARFNVFSWDAFSWWLEDHPIFERPTTSTYFGLFGTATAPVPSSAIPISATFDGSFSYCAAATEPTTPNYPPLCSAPIECKSPHHQLTLSRR
jgi:hypothetical protein